MPKYSVALASYNGESFINAQLKSIIEQTVPPSEIIISDDGSSDETISIAKNILNDSKIHYKIFKNLENHGVIGNFSNAINHCVNDIIFTSDQDDIWYPCKAEEIIGKFESNNNLLLIFTDGDIVDKKLKSLGSSIWEAVGLSSRDEITGDELFNTMLNRCIVTGATMAFKKKLFNTANPIPKEWLHDGWLAWIAALNNGLLGYNRKLIAYRQHSNNVVGMSAQSASLKRIKGWYKSLDEIVEVRKYRYERYKSLLVHGDGHLSATQKHQIQNCISFWSSLCEIEKKSFFKNFVTINKLYLRGYYNKYFNGFKGYLRDLIYIFKLY